MARSGAEVELAGEGRPVVLLAYEAARIGEQADPDETLWSRQCPLRTLSRMLRASKSSPGGPGSGQAQTPPGVPGQPGERLLADVDGAGGADESGEGIDERRLACTVGADEGRDLAGLGFMVASLLAVCRRIERSRPGRTGLHLLAI